MSEVLRFLALSDFGNPTPAMKGVAKAMAHYATHFPINSVFALGDNFYPYGVASSTDRQFTTSWKNVFLRYPSLRVPWRVVLGNHDYMGNPKAQIDFHYDTTSNVDGLWYMPEANYKLSFGNSSEEAGTEVHPSVDIFFIDTNGCQDHVRRSHPDTVAKMHRSLRNLRQKLSTSTADFKFVCGHHPLYTQGRGHALPSQCLRESVYEYVTHWSEGESELREGFGLEQILLEGGVDVYVAGHEHIFQYRHFHGLHHVGCGASGADIRPGSGMYGGTNPQPLMDWVGGAQQLGFVALEVARDEHGRGQALVSFVDVHQQVLKQVRVGQRTPEEKAREAAARNHV